MTEWCHCKVVNESAWKVEWKAEVTAEFIPNLETRWT